MFFEKDFNLNLWNHKLAGQRHFVLWSLVRPVRPVNIFGSANILGCVKHQISAISLVLSSASLSRNSVGLVNYLVPG